MTSGYSLDSFSCSISMCTSHDRHSLENQTIFSCVKGWSGEAKKSNLVTVTTFPWFKSLHRNLIGQHHARSLDLALKI